MQESESSRTHTEVKCNGFAVRHAAGAEAVRGCRRRRSCVTLLRDCEQMASEELCRPRNKNKEFKNQTQRGAHTGTNKERKARGEFFFSLSPLFV